MLNNIAREFGFEDAKEFNRLVASLDLSTGERLQAFKEWQNNDGTKAGLLKLKEPAPVPTEIEYSNFSVHTARTSVQPCLICDLEKKRDQ